MSPPDAWPFAEGECARLLLQPALASSPLGPPSGWHPAVRQAVQTLLACGLPMCLALGPEMRLVYNDAYARVLGPRHPQAFGMPRASAWPEVGDEVAAMFAGVMQGESFTALRVPFLLRRQGVAEQTWFDYTLSPLRADSGEVLGVLSVSTERTAEVVTQTRTQERLGFFTQMLEDAPCFVAVLRGPQWRFDYVNRAHVELHGRDVSGLTLAQAVPAGFAAELGAILDGVVATRTPYLSGARRIPLPRGERLATVAMRPLLEADAVTGVVIVGFDTTEAARAQKSLESVAAQFEAITNAVPQLVFASEAGGNVFVNQRYCEFVGRSAGELLGSGWQDFVHPDDRAQAMQRWESALATGEDYESEQRMRRADGSYRWMLVRATRVKLAGANAQWMGTCTDFHESRLLQEELALARRRMSAAMVAGDIALLSWDLRHDRVLADENLARLFGVPAGAAQGASAELFLERILPEDLAQVRRTLADALAQGEFIQVAYRVRRPGGGHRHIQSRGRIERDAGGTATWMSAVVMDISELMLAQESLKAGDRRKDEFLAMLAHELRNPLAPIVSAAAVLPRLKDDAARVAQMGEIISRQARHLTGLVDDLLDVSRVTRGQVQLAQESVGLESVLMEALEQAQPSATARGQSISHRFPAGPVHVRGDRKRLVQVFVNILQNASRYTPEGGRIVLSAQATQDMVRVQVDDTGIGMSPQLCATAFELFVQGERSAERSQGGLGLGLALVRSLVTLHGGTVTAHSDGPGLGSSFRVELPRAQEPGDEAPGSSPGSRTGQGRVLVVDDNQDAAELLGLLLEDAGFQAWTCHSPSEALSLAASIQPQACLLDIGLPEFDGYTLARRLLELPGLQGTRLAAVTGYAQPADLARSKAAGFDRHFAKPVEPSALVDWLASLGLGAPAPH